MKLLGAHLLVILTMLGSAVAGGQERQKVPGTELQEWFSKGYVVSGVNEGNGCVFIVINHSLDGRQQYYNCAASEGTAKGEGRIDGDRICSTWEYTPTEVCTEVHRIGDNQYETKGGPYGQDRVRFYKLK